MNYRGSIVSANGIIEIEVNKKLNERVMMIILECQRRSKGLSTNAGIGMLEDFVAVSLRDKSWKLKKGENCSVLIRRAKGRKRERAPPPTIKYHEYKQSDTKMKDHHKRIQIM